MTLRGVHGDHPRAEERDATRHPPVLASGKLPELDGLRGVAAMVVVVWHFVLAFMPARIGIIHPYDPAQGVVGNPLFALLNGPGAVTLFFVLSGYVLPLAFFRAGRADTLLRAGAKRWFRLVGLALLAAVTSWALFRVGAYHYRDAGSLAQSAWLRGFGGGDQHWQIQPSLHDAVLEGGVFAFLQASDVYNPVLWTMREELFGSLMTFALAAVIWRAPPVAGTLLLALAAAATQVLDPRLAPFVVGLGLSWMHTRGIRAPAGWVAWLCLVAGLLLFGYIEPRGFYAPLEILPAGSAARLDQIWVHTAAGVLMILGLLGTEPARRLLASAGGRLLGRLSFPVYLFHFPLLCSLTCWLYLTLQPVLPYGAALAVAGLASLPVLIAVAYAFARVDEAWLAQVNRVARRVIPATGSPR